MRRVRRITTLIVALPLLALALGSYLYLARVSRDFSARLPEVISEAASKQINGDLRIGKVEVHPFGIAVKDVTLSESRALGGKQVLAAPEARISCSIWDMVARGADPARSVKSVDFLKPAVFLERFPNGTWNVSRLMKKLRPEKPLRFTGKVRFISARVSVHDRMRNLAKPVDNRLSDVNLIVDFSKPRLAGFTAWGIGPRGRMRQFTISGQYALDRRGYDAEVQALGLDARYFRGYPWRIGLNVLSGRANAGIRLSKPGKGMPIKYAAVIEVRDAAVGFGGLRQPVKQVVGDAFIANGRASVDFRSRLGSTPLTVSGDVRDFKRPTLALQVASARANLREAVGLAGYAREMKGFALPGNGAFKAFISGPPRSPVVDFELSAPSISCAQLAGRSLHARGTYRDRRIALRNASVSAYGGLIEAAGTIDLSPSPSADLVGRATRISLDKVPLAAKQRTGIVSSGRFRASVRRRDVQLAYRGSIRDFTAQGIRFENGAVDLAYGNGGLRINEISARALDGLLAVSGKVGRNGELKLKASGADVNLAKVGKLCWKSQTVGHLNFKGEVTGTLKSPVFQGEIEAYRAMVSGVGIPRIAGKLTASREKVVLDNVVAEDYPGSLAISGVIRNPFAKTPTLNLTAKADSLDLGEYASEYLPEGGKLFGDVIIQGALPTPTADANLRIEGGNYRDIPVDALVVRAGYKDDTISIRELSARSGDSSIIASGEIAPDGKLSIGFESKSIVLEKLAALFGPYAAVSGSATIAGNITGTLDAPVAEAKIECEAPTVNTRRFAHFTAKASWREGVTSLSDCVLSDAASEYSIPRASYDPVSRKLVFESQMQNVQAGKLLAILDASPALKSPGFAAGKLQGFLSRIARPFSGVVNGGISGSVEFGEKGAVPELGGDLTVADMNLGLNTFKSIHLKGSWSKDVTRLETLEAREGDMTVSAHGQIGPSEALDLEVQGGSLDVATLCRWLDVQQNFSGKADVTIVASGSRRAPTSDIDIKIANPAIGGAKFDGLTSHMVLVETPAETGAEARINISELALSLGDRSLKVSGYVPVNMRDFSVPENAPLLVQSNLDADSLAILSRLSGIAMETGASGSFDGSVKLGSTVKSPKVEGTLNWTDGRVQIPRLNSPLQGITARMSLVGDRITIQELTGRSAEGGDFAATGAVSLVDLMPSLDLSIQASGLGLSGRNISGIYGEDVRVKLEGTVKVTDYWRTPLVAGTLDVPEGSVALPNKPVKKLTPTGPPPLDPRFDLKAIIEKGVRFGAARLKSPMSGKLDIAGSLTKPAVDGTLDVSGGTIIFPMRRFKMLPGSTISLHTNPGKGIGVTVDVTAQTRMSALSELGKRKQYSITMVAHGPLDNLNPDFNSSPPDLSQQRIVALLAGQGEFEALFARNGTGNFGKDISAIFSTALMPSVFEPIEEGFESLGFEEFALEMSYGEPLQLTIGQHLFDGLHLDYSAVLGARTDYADSAYQLRLYYRFKRGLELGAQTDDNHTLTLGVEGTLRY